MFAVFVMHRLAPSCGASGPHSTIFRHPPIAQRRRGCDYSADLISWKVATPKMRSARRLLSIVAAMIGVSTQAQTASRTPVPPCAGTPYPDYGDVDGPLRVEVLLGGDVPNDWTPPPCTGWKAGPTKVLMGAAGRFRHSGNITDILARIVAVSQLTGVVYWSQTRQVWRRLFESGDGLLSLRRRHSDGPRAARCPMIPAAPHPG